VTNIDCDHLGAYGGKFMNLVGAFEQFLAQCAEREGSVIGCGDDAEVSKIIRGMKQSVLYGELDSNQVKISYDAKTNSAVVARGGTAGLFHMIRGDEKSYQNAVAAALACEAAGVPFDEALHLLKVFPGMERRMQVLGEWRGVTVLTDHADHPTEIRATLQAVSVRYPGRRLDLVLQPHRYSRVSTCLEQYGSALSGVGRIMLLDIFAAGETIEQPDALNERLRASIETVVGGSLQKRMSVQQALDDLLASVVPGEVVLFMGPGDVNRLGLRFCSLLSGSNAVEYDPVARPTVHGRQEND
jgi:UDP-N-acetylmuramate--alanine ligase